MKIVTFAPYEIGDTIMATPLYAALRRLYPQATLDLVSERENHPVLEGLNLFDHIFIFKNNFDFSDYDLAVMPVFSCSEIVHTCAQRAKRYIALPHLYPLVPRNWKKRLTTAYRHMLFEKHQVELNMDLVGMLGYKGDTPRPYCPNSPTELFTEHRNKIGCCIYTPQTKFQAQRNRFWPLGHWHKLISMLGRENVVCVGGIHDQPTIEKIVSLTDCSFQITPSIEEFVGLCRQLKVLITTDHGAMHIAATSAVPIVSLHGTSSPVLLHPWVGTMGKSISILSPNSCSPCQRSYRLQLCEKGLTAQTCMENIVPSDVAKAITLIENVTRGYSFIMLRGNLLSIEEFCSSWPVRLRHLMHICLAREVLHAAQWFRTKDLSKI